MRWQKLDEHLGTHEFRWRKLDEYLGQHGGAWEASVDRVRAYVQEFGDARVPNGYQTTDGFRLGVWLRFLQKQARKGNLSQARVDAFKALGVDL